MEEEEDKFLMCSPADPSYDHMVVDGATKMWCGKCHHSVWVSVSGQNMIEKGVVKPENIICLHCYNKMAAEADEPIKTELTPEVFGELLGQLVIDAERHGAKPKKLYDFLKSLVAPSGAE